MMRTRSTRVARLEAVASERIVLKLAARYGLTDDVTAFLRWEVHSMVRRWQVGDTVELEHHQTDLQTLAAEIDRFVTRQQHQHQTRTRMPI